MFPLMVSSTGELLSEVATTINPLGSGKGVGVGVGTGEGVDDVEGVYVCVEVESGVNV